MIPDHLIDKAVTAAGTNWAMTEQWQHDKLHAQVAAALHAVAGDIWDEGFTRGVSADSIDADLHETREIDLNPYRASEA